MEPRSSTDDELAPPDVTIVVVPRERFSVSLRSLETLYENTDPPFDLVYVDGGSPRPIRRGIDEAAGKHGFSLIRTEHHLSPNQARNLALAQVRTPFVVFVDNDVVVTPGWLEPLVRCARDTGAWVVGPLNFEGELDDAEVHNAGGFLEWEDADGRRMLVQDNRWGHRHHSELPSDLQRVQVDYVEFHCVLVQRRAFDEIGPLDEGLLSTREHLDLCLQVRAAGGEVWSELTSWVTYDHPPPVTRTDLPFFMLRWSETWTMASLRHFVDKYGLAPEYLERRGSARRRRWAALGPFRSRLRETFGDTVDRAFFRLVRTAEPRLNEKLLGRRARALASTSESR